MKAIGIIRTSTTKQEVDSQRSELINFIKSDGYTDDDILIIGGSGASAIKLDDEYLQNLNELYRQLSTGEYNCVYAWAIDRIGRNEEILMKLKNTLIKAKINLKIKNPFLTLMNVDGSKNDGMELAFSLFTTMAKQEMETKKVRFARAKARNKKEGKYNGGRITFGYRLDDSGHFTIDEADAEKVLYIYNEYINTPKSTSVIAKECMELGYIDQYSQKKSADHFIQMVLKNKDYLGQGVQKYPRLISDETFEKVAEKRKNFRTLPKVHYSETPYYCQGLIYEVQPGQAPMRMRVKKSEKSYVSYSEKISVNINNIDSMMVQILDDVLKHYDSKSAEEESEKQKQRLNNLINQLEKKLSVQESKKDELDEKYFVDMAISKDKYNQLTSKLNKEILNTNVSIDEARTRLYNLSNVTPEEINIYNVDDETRKEIVMQYVSSIYVRKTSKFQCWIDIDLKLPIFQGYSVMYDRQTKSYWTYFNDEPLEHKINIIRDIKGRKRDYKGYKNGKQLDIQG